MEREKTDREKSQIKKDDSETGGRQGEERTVEEREK